MRLKAVDLWAGLALMALAAAYYAAARAIPESLLSDEVGAAGLPTLLAAALGACGALLTLRSQAASTMAISFAISPRALGLIAVMAAYIVLMPVAGYPIMLAALIIAAALIAGLRPAWSLLVTAPVAGVVFWLIFVRLFGIAMPAGLLAGWI
jgi:putative tricarboxylic transport membrane protein